MGQGAGAGREVDEQALVDAIAGRRDELVALACDLIRFDTQSRVGPDAPARQEAALQALPRRAAAGRGAEVDVWEPRRRTSPATRCAAGGIGFEGRPQLAARFAGSRRRTLAAAQRPHRRGLRAARGRLGARPVRPAGADGQIIGRGACDMKGGIAAMVVAAEALAAPAACAATSSSAPTPTRSPAASAALACARHGVSADFAIVPEPSALDVWPACRGSVYCTVTVAGRSGHAEQEHPHFRDGGAVNAIDSARHLLDGVDRLRADWRSRAAPPPAAGSARRAGDQPAADAGWPVTIPNRAKLTLAVLILPCRPTPTAGRPRSQAEVEGFLARGATAIRGWPSTRPSSPGTRR